MNDKTNIQLVEDYCNGNDRAFTMLIERYRSSMMKYCYRLLKNYDIVEDVFQEACIRVAEGLKRGLYQKRVGTSFASWFSSICHNVAIDYHRKKGRNAAAPMAVENDRHEFVLDLSLESSIRGVEEAIIRDERHRTVRKWIQELPPEQQEVIILRIYGDKSFQEIAAIQNCNVNTALGRMRYALINLRRLAKNPNYEYRAGLERFIGIEDEQPDLHFEFVIEEYVEVIQEPKPMISGKACRVCGIHKDIDEFHVEMRNRDGYKNDCRECLKAYHRERRERKLKNAG